MIPYVVITGAFLLIALAGLWMMHVTGKDTRARDRAWEKKEAAWNVERQQLLDRIMYLADKPWETPQADEIPEPEPHPDDIPYDPTLRPIEAFDLDYMPMETV